MLCDNEYYMAGGAFLAIFGWMTPWPYLSLIGVIMLMIGFFTID